MAPGHKRSGSSDISRWSILRVRFNLAHPPAARRKDVGENIYPPSKFLRGPPGGDAEVRVRVCGILWTTAKQPSLLPNPFMTYDMHPHTGTTAVCPHSGPRIPCVCLWVYCCIRSAITFLHSSAAVTSPSRCSLPCTPLPCPVVASSCVLVYTEGLDPRGEKGSKDFGVSWGPKRAPKGLQP